MKAVHNLDWTSGQCRPGKNRVGAHDYALVESFLSCALSTASGKDTGFPVSLDSQSVKSLTTSFALTRKYSQDFRFLDRLVLSNNVAKIL